MPSFFIGSERLSRVAALAAEVVRFNGVRHRELIVCAVQTKTFESRFSLFSQLAPEPPLRVPWPELGHEKDSINIC